jgi:hypothetical protein
MVIVGISVKRNSCLWGIKRSSSIYMFNYIYDYGSFIITFPFIVRLDKQERDKLIVTFQKYH